jgi:hypothetical protein
MASNTSFELFASLTGTGRLRRPAPQRKRYTAQPEMRRTMMKVVALAICWTMVPSAAFAASPCEREAEALATPLFAESRDCVGHLIWQLGSGQHIRHEFAEALVQAALSPIEGQVASATPLPPYDWSAIATLIILLDNDDLIQPYLDFYFRTSGSANEARSFGLGRLYIERGPKLLELVRARARNVSTRMRHRLLII